MVLVVLYSTLGPGKASVAADSVRLHASAPEFMVLASTESVAPSATPARVVSAFPATNPVPPGSAAGPNPAPTPVPDACEPAASELYCVYTVQSGDTLTSIAQSFGLQAGGAISPSMLLAESNRPDVVDADAILPGQKLRIPREAGVIHTVITSESLAQLAASYGISSDAVRAVGANGLGSGESLPAGRELLIPEPRLLPQAASGAATDDEEKRPQSTPAAQLADSTATSAPQSTPTIAAASRTASPTRTPTPSATPRPSSGRGPSFAWPAEGPISSYFGPAHPLGIDIDFFADVNEPVKAAAAGTVTFAGGDACCSYGYYIVIEHSDGFTTLYAHLSGFMVKAGDRVRQGQVIGRGGKTGYATGLHLHFEIRRDGRVVDPLRFLP